MLIKSDNPTTSASPACVQCGVKEKRLLHQVRHRGVFRRLCTTCVLRLHPQSFCPTCYQVYPPPPPNDAVLSCFKCYSSTHSHCVPSPAPSPYICPLCTNPTAPIFKLKTIDSTGEEGKGVECRVMDVDSAKKLLAAAKISSASMNKAAVAARVEAEKRAKEAAFARKKAKEALEHVSYMVVREKLRKKEVPGSNGFAQVKSENHVNVVNNGSSRNGIVSSIAAGSSSVVMEEEEKISAAGEMDRVENSNQVLEALNAVELRENENKNGIESNDDCVSMMDVDESGSVEIEKNVGGIDHVMENGSSENLVIEEDVENDEVVEDQVQYVEEDNTGGENQANGTPH